MADEALKLARLCKCMECSRYTNIVMQGVYADDHDKPQIARGQSCIVHKIMKAHWTAKPENNCSALLLFTTSHIDTSRQS